MMRPQACPLPTYRCCRGADVEVLVVFAFVRSWLSTEYSVNGWYISSQLCSDQ